MSRTGPFENGPVPNNRITLHGDEKPKTTARSLWLQNGRELERG
jgi:hypothetical protein